MKNHLTSKYWFGDMVYLKHCPEQKARMITDIYFEGSPDKVSYSLSSGSDKSVHYESEISTERDEIIAMGAFNDNN